jgi:hypothetical protein
MFGCCSDIILKLKDNEDFKLPILGTELKKKKRKNTKL